MSKVTAPPWKINTSGGMTYVENFYGQSICRVATSNADARLIAAAPELLEALERLATHMAGKGFMTADLDPEVSADAAVIVARNAIAKANEEK